MPNREKVVKGLYQHCEGSMFDRCGECPYYEVADEPFRCRDALLMDVLALLREQSSDKDTNVLGKGISVKDRLPEDTRFVLVCNDDKIIMVAQYIDETAQWQYPYIAYDVDVWDEDEQGPIMWWMPLPKPPKEVSGDA